MLANMTRRGKYLLYVAIGLLIVATAGIAAVRLRQPATIVTPQVASQLTSTLFVPQVGDVAVVRATVKYDASLKVLSYVVRTDGTVLTVSEQPTPDSFVDVPGVYTKTIEGMKGYQSFDSVQGHVDLTRPTTHGDKQTAVMNAKGTLLFVKADHDLTIDQWKQFFRALAIQA